MNLAWFLVIDFLKIEFLNFALLRDLQNYIILWRVCEYLQRWFFILGNFYLDFRKGTMFSLCGFARFHC